MRTDHFPIVDVDSLAVLLSAEIRAIATAQGPPLGNAETIVLGDGTSIYLEYADGRNSPVCCLRVDPSAWLRNRVSEWMPKRDDGAGSYSHCTVALAVDLWRLLDAAATWIAVGDFSEALAYANDAAQIVNDDYTPADAVRMLARALRRVA